MKTLLISDIFPPKTGGSGRWLWEIYRRQPDDLTVIAAGEDSRAEEFDHTHDLNLHRMPLPVRDWGITSVAGFMDYRRSLAKLRALREHHEYTQVHCARCLPEGWMALRLKATFGTPYVCYVHGEEANYATASRVLSWMMRRVLAGAQFVIANCRNSKRLLVEDWQLKPDKIRILHPGCDTRQFVPADRDPATRRKLGWDDRLVVLTVGRLQERKGQDQMIRAVAAIRDSVPNVLYSIVGDGEDRSRLKRLVAELDVAGHVDFRGEPNDEELIRCYQQCDLFVLANRQVGEDIEGFGMVLVEAQACGKPVLAGASGGTAETMKIPETGQVIPCETPNHLAEIIPDLLLSKERCEQMGRAGRKWAVEQFDWENLSVEAHKIMAHGFSAAKECI